MESRFAHLRQRDTSVSMLRVKMSRRRSQSQKENRERAVNTRRQLDKLPELEMSSLDASIAISTHAAEERMKQLERWKERKALEKEKKERDCKGVFKTGLYHPKDNLTISLPVVSAAPKTKESDRVTRSMKQQQQVQKVLFSLSFINEPEVKKPEMQEPEEKPHPPTLTLCSEEEDMVVDPSPADSVSTEEPIVTASSLSSFAPQGFTFQAPAGLSSFKFEPLTPRSADAFLTPSSSFSLPPAPVFTPEPEAESGDSSPPKSPRRSPHTSPIVAPLNSGSPLESMHDVPYFRSEIANETDRLTSLCVHWESKVKDESIPEEMRDRMRTAVGQARLLMKERFNQFSGLVDDCELGRGEKITTCTDLQGFWDMVYFQVEDVTKKFNALKEAEDRGWVEEHKPPPQQRKKPPTAAAKPTGSKAAAKSRLAAIKAAMKARQQAAEAEKAAKDAGNTEDNLCHNPQEPQPQAEAHMSESLVFDGGFFRVESPAKHLGERKSHRFSDHVSVCFNAFAWYFCLTIWPNPVVHTVMSEIPGLDFERYLQPSQRCSPSPRGTVAIETLSPMAMDVELDSPEGQYEDPLTQQEPGMIDTHKYSESALLLFTPDVKDRIRQSVCPSDLMVFTPPSNA
uniref:Discs, large (Drosophila) homolog-associated protein 5 n=1 Tax=Mastacembelus armatus TaxID=205130 RepID=A0A7N8YPE1_9TELE